MAHPFESVLKGYLDKKIIAAIDSYIKNPE